jgi:MFS family permease
LDQTGGIPANVNQQGATAQAPGAAGQTAAQITARWAYSAFAILFVMHLLDYIDRWALAGVLKNIQEELKIDDEPAGSLNFYFLLTYSLIGPVMGQLGDRFKRTRLLSLGIGIWSLATIGTGLVQNFGQLSLARCVLGVGEATYGILAPTILMDLFKREQRARVLSCYYLAMPLGYAIGVAVSGAIALHSPRWFAGTFLEPWAGWRLAFFLVGIPGFIAAIAVLFLKEPVRGLAEGVDLERLSQHERAGATLADYRDLLVNSSYTYTIFGLAAFTFAFGGLAFWLPKYLVTVKGIPQDQANLALGLTSLAAAIVGMAGGGFLCDRLSRRIPAAPFWVSGCSMLLAVPCVLLGLASKSQPMTLLWLFLAQALMFANTGPANSVIASVILPSMRATAYSICNLTIHLLGDLWSPWLMGMVSDLAGKPSFQETPVGKALLAVGAAPVDGKNLSAGMLIVVPAILLGGLVLLAGVRHLPREMALMLARLRAAPTHGHEAHLAEQRRKGRS